MIHVLDKNTIDKIAAGEVIERPAAVVKELVENSIDAGATAITIEIKQGGISFIRITDNGCGIAREEIPMAFQRHATSKISSIEDLLCVKSLGFRGEALSSIAAVSQVELITKDADSIAGCRYEIQGGEETVCEEIGCPDGTTFLVRNLFYNTPARGKFLKTKTTEGNYVNDVVLHFTLSHPEIRFKFINDGRTKVQTSGNGNVKDNIFQQFGADIVKELLLVEVEDKGMRLTGYIGKPQISRGTRSFMNYYINGRHIKSAVIQKAIETAYQGFTMTGRFPFTTLFLDIDSSYLDVNVHPSKMEVRFTNQEEVFELFSTHLHDILKQADLIPSVTLEKNRGKTQGTKKTADVAPMPEPFETGRAEKRPEDAALVPIKTVPSETSSAAFPPKPFETDPAAYKKTPIPEETAYHQESFFDRNMLQEEGRVEFRLLGQVFDTYWLIEYSGELLIIDQHAAHEKVLYEKIIRDVRENHIYSQNLAAPIVLSLTHREKEVLEKYGNVFAKLGFEIDEFGGDEYAVKAVPSHFLHLSNKKLFYSILDELLEHSALTSAETITDRCATIACKAAVKGNNRLSVAEAEKLIAEMLRADEPYHCPHGRPTTISLSKRELEKKFKRIV